MTRRKISWQCCRVFLNLTTCFSVICSVSAITVSEVSSSYCYGSGDFVTCTCSGEQPEFDLPVPEVPGSEPKPGATSCGPGCVAGIVTVCVVVLILLLVVWLCLKKDKLFKSTVCPTDATLDKKPPSQPPQTQPEVVKSTPPGDI